MGEARAAEGTEGMSDTIPDAVIEAMAREFYSSHAPNPWRAALAAADKLGWRLCPREPTNEMQEARRDALKKRVNSLPPEQRPWFSRPTGGYYFSPQEKCLVRWRAMWDAAPKVSK